MPSNPSRSATEIVALLEERFRWQVQGLETLEGLERERAGDLAIAYATVLCDVTDEPEAWAARIRFVIITVNAPKHRKL